MTELALPTFDVCGALPAGTTVLEASAGTGKTYTIAALTARYVAEGRADLDQMMLVTFGRMASDELRQRVRLRLVSTERAMAHARGGGSARGADEVERLLTTGTDAELAARHGRLVRALANFDAATIATTHEFCLHMLTGLGVLGDREPAAVFVEQLTDLSREVAGDVYLRRYATGERPAPLAFEPAVALAVDAVNAGTLPLVPGVAADSGQDPAARERVEFAAEVRREVERRKRRGRLFTYDDMLTRLRDSLADPDHGAAATRRLRSRYSVVLVDEFQDTDPVQWEILRRAFHGHATIVLIGDPKQAIYGFRGADVYSYLDAVQQADQVATLGTNWRSDRELVEAMGTVFGGAALGDPRIVVREVGSVHPDRRLRPPTDRPPLEMGNPGPLAPVRIRVLDQLAEDRVRPVSQLRADIAADLVADVTALLASGAQLCVAGKPRPVGPADLAILVRTNERGEALRDALAGAGVPAVLLGATSVFTSPAATDWLTLLTALEQPRPAQIRRASLTCFLGWTVARLAAAGGAELSSLTAQIRWWSRVLASRGVAALHEAVAADTRLTERVLRHHGGERLLTDLRHVAQALHTVMLADQLGISALAEWLRERMAEARASLGGDASRRLETDADCVQILTVHRSKGLEFPIVYLPDAWDRHVATTDEGQNLRVHDPDCDPAPLVLDVGGATGLGRAQRLGQYRLEEAGEDLRLLYVAMTRAQCQVVTWWAPSKNTPTSALQRFWYGPRQLGAEPALRYDPPDTPLDRPLGGGCSVERWSPRPATAWQPPRPQVAELVARPFERTLDQQWRRTSYSALTAAAHGADPGGPAVGSEVETFQRDDEVVPAIVVPSPVSTDPALSQPSPWQDLPSGVQFGTLVHGILEQVDFAAADLPAEVHRTTAEQLSRHGDGSLALSTLTAALLSCLDTGLGSVALGCRLRDIASDDRLTELDFELPLAGGDRTTAEVTLRQVADLLSRELPPDDPLASYPELLRHPSLADQPLRGYLTGSIDAVLRVRTADGAPRYLIVDYKTNWLGAPDSEELRLADYTPNRLTEAMAAAHYPLQALLYAVAVHRFLRWRQPGYQPGEHLGGVLYLFLRGMAGPQTPLVQGSPCGVFGWRPPARLIAALSDLLDGADGSGR